MLIFQEQGWSSGLSHFHCFIIISLFFITIIIVIIVIIMIIMIIIMYVLLGESYQFNAVMSMATAHFNFLLFEIQEGRTVRTGEAFSLFSGWWSGTLFSGWFFIIFWLDHNVLSRSGSPVDCAFYIFAVVRA